jgi:hypothetical protein
MKYTEEEISNIIKSVEAFTNKKVANYQFVSYSTADFNAMSLEDFVNNNQVLYGDFRIGHLDNNETFSLQYNDNFGNQELIVTYLGKSDNIKDINGVIWNSYDSQVDFLTFSGILFNLVDVVTPTFAFSFQKTFSQSLDIGFNVGTVYGLAQDIGNVYVNFGDGAGILAFNKDIVGVNNPAGTIPVNYSYAKAGIYTITVYSEYPINSIYITDEFSSLMGANNFNIIQGILYNFNRLSIAYQETNLNTNFITDNPSALGSAEIIELCGNALTTAKVNALLIHFQNMQANGKIIVLNNQNPLAPPSGAGITAKNWLIANGNTVFTD